MPSSNLPFPRIGAHSPVTVLRQLLTGWRRPSCSLSMSGLTIEILLPVSTVMLHALPLMVPETVRVLPVLCMDPVLKTSLGA